jgi:predicted alpha/beta-fold hydrolase
MTVKHTEYNAPWWLPEGHLQTLWTTLTRRRPPIFTRRERLELPDGDFLDLDWVGGGLGPIVVVLHGLEGSIESPYARGLLSEVVAKGWRGVLVHFRGCSGAPNRLPRAYHSGDTGDVTTVVAEIQRRAPGVPIAAVGYSLGGNVLLKWLGERGGKSPLTVGVAVSVPFVLSDCATHLDQGFAKVYQAHFVHSLKATYTRKQPLGVLRDIRSIREWDDRVTAPLHGFDGADDYYTRSSSRQFLGQIEVPTLILHARDDPFMTPAVIPRADELSKSITMEVSRSGGHVGFVSGDSPLQPEYWLEKRIPAFLAQHLTPE